MKKLIASVAVLLLITTYLISCEKDDICAEDTPTTPGLVVEFYNNDTDTVRTVTDFVYWSEGREKDTLKTGTKIILPLRTDSDEVTWSLQYNSTIAGIKKTNTDLFTVKYTRVNTFVSRACGYKTTFTLIPEATGSPNPLIEPGTDGPFIERYDVETTNIEYQDEAHVKLYF